MLANPMYVHSISSNGDNQDVVSMGTNAALICSKVVENTYQVLAIQLLTVVQAVDALDFSPRLSSQAKGVYNEIRNLVPKFEGDSIMYKKLERIKNHLQSQKLNFIEKKGSSE